MEKLEEGQKLTIREQIKAIMVEDIPVAQKDLDTKRWPDEDVARLKKLGELRASKIGALKAQSVIDAFNARLQEVAPDGKVSFNGIDIYRISKIGDNGVEIFLSPHGIEPEYRIFNPPTLVLDPMGGIEVYNKKHREDPLAAVFAVIGNNKAGKKVR